ncbi:MAG TPA: gamma-glutamylcyclotransferase family protein [Thermoanaerobaculia bacterium]|nr:gamma-glutamylcyclotransferase family protein [Thermoanaerobaculia bacterium]
MTDASRVPLYFYGLFMDADLLREKDAAPANIRRVSVPGWSLRIGRRATLVRQAGARSHGMLMELTHDEIDRLYAEPSLIAYRPEPVLAENEDGSVVAALAFNLPVPPAPHERNAAYAEKLRALAQRLSLPADYIASIE